MLLLDALPSDFGRRRNRDLSLTHGLDQAVIVSATLSWICLKQKRVGQSPLSSHKRPSLAAGATSEICPQAAYRRVAPAA